MMFWCGAPDRRDFDLLVQGSQGTLGSSGTPSALAYLQPRCCAKFDDSIEYGVSGEVNDDEPTKTTTSSKAVETTTTMTTSSSTEATQAPTTTSSGSDHKLTQPGIAKNCDKFHKVVDGDSCDAIVASARITHSQFSEWNPYINDKCSNIWLDYYVCIHSGIAKKCDKFHNVISGDQCDSIESGYKITHKQSFTQRYFGCQSRLDIPFFTLLSPRFEACLFLNNAVLGSLFDFILAEDGLVVVE
ncbi:hypothetical protein N7467_009914 [Penicillium canescens]|nr:hypothetical protein N7467_009914 [Penicillium canescens]